MTGLESGGNGDGRMPWTVASGRWSWWVRVAVRKTAWGLLALWGISLVTFVVVQLALAGASGRASGATQGLSSGMTAADLEELRKTYGWDLPLLLNFHVQDRGRRARRDLDAFVRRPGCKSCRQRLLRRGTLIFPEVFSMLHRRVPGDAKEALCGVVGEILSARGWPDSPENPGDCATWWQRHQVAFSRSSIAATLHGALVGDQDAAGKLLRLGRRAVPEIFQGLLGSIRNRRRLCIASGLLSRITGHSVWCDHRAKEAAGHAVIESWRDWWDAHELDYRDLSGEERVAGLVTRTRYGRWVARLVHGRLGMSSYYRRPVTHVLAERLPVTFGIGMAALVLAFVVGLPVGLWLSLRRQKRAGRILDAALLVAYCSPTYVVGLGLLFLLGGLGGLAVFPVGGLHSLARPGSGGTGLLDVIWHSVLPVVTLAFGLLAMVARYSGESVNRVLQEPFILAARARGLPEWRLVWNHALRNGLLPLINLFGLMIPALVTGAVVVETIFDLPGLGQALMVALWNRDPNLFMGILLVSALATMAGIGLAELGMWVADPRLRHRMGEVGR